MFQDIPVVIDDKYIIRIDNTEVPDLGIHKKQTDGCKNQETDMVSIFYEKFMLHDTGFYAEKCIYTIPNNLEDL
ncbi:MAG: hypothetical protein B5M56_07045 [Desulfococcus sp. 4484_241]|nr:MAG: hypothetical protein B5M56_07045 [Desulfococcus sp. 4484_241]